jgi:hypothetical protein
MMQSEYFVTKIDTTETYILLCLFLLSSGSELFIWFLPKQTKKQ